MAFRLIGAGLARDESTGQIVPVGWTGYPTLNGGRGNPLCPPGAASKDAPSPDHDGDASLEAMPSVNALAHAPLPR